ncbi:SDR family oxidoreductase [Saccharibacillus sp. CPCC 101409]|nr:SDR family oxidoreductase [Saccharibacillus sp. CPCC 101409]MDO3411425.1 SDR family oxidoreductase [Saccharibacillus sp. CPCC 101409]
MNTILITGASSGIGKATASYFAAKGWNVIATMRAPEEETELINRENILVVRLDVENEKTIASAVDEGIGRFGRIDVLLNNAGYGAFGIFEAASEQQVQRQFGVNVFGVMNVTKALLPHFRKQGAGTIINVSSMLGKIGFPFFSLYAAAKWAVEGFSESLHYELSAHNIRVKIIEPGYVATDFSGRSIEVLADDRLGSAYQEQFQAVLNKQMENLQGDLSTPTELAEIIYEAATDNTAALRYIAGEDARFALTQRQNHSDETFMASIAEQFQLS